MSKGKAFIFTDCGVLLILEISQYFFCSFCHVILVNQLCFFVLPNPLSCSVMNKICLKHNFGCKVANETFDTFVGIVQSVDILCILGTSSI